MATIKDIANAAGVSVATVSHVVNNTRFVSPELRKRVEEAIANAETPPNFVVKKKMQEKCWAVCSGSLSINSPFCLSC